MIIHQFNAETYALSQRVAAWRESLREQRLYLVKRPDADELRGTIYSRTLRNGLKVARIAASAQSLGYLTAEDDELWCALHLEGEVTFESLSEQGQLAAGDLTYGTSCTAATFDFESDFRYFILRVPRALIDARLTPLMRKHAGRIVRRGAVGHVLTQLLSALAETIDTVEPTHMTWLEDMLLECLLQALSAGQPSESGAEESNHQSSVFDRVCKTIEVRLGDPELKLTAIAAEHRISVRYLQKLFESRGHSFSSFLRGKRLERCRVELVSPLYQHLPIADVFSRWGFSDASHFSHAFRSQFGMSPRSYRKTLSGNNASALVARAGDLPMRPDAPKSSQNRVKPNAARADELSHAVALADAISELPKHHVLRANKDTVHWGFFRRDLSPVLEINSGDRVTIETVTQHASDDGLRMIQGDAGAESIFGWTKGDLKARNQRHVSPVDSSVCGRDSGDGFGVHVCTGPIYVRDARPGDVLEIRIIDIAPRMSGNPLYECKSFGSNVAGWWGYHYNEMITEPRPREVVTVYEIDWTASGSHNASESGSNAGATAKALYNFRWTPQRDPLGKVHPNMNYPGVPVDRSTVVEVANVMRDVRIPVRPHFGLIAVAPREVDPVDSIPPTYFGGNLDNWRLGVGASLFLPVAVAGALLSVGDPHASQGDGQVSGTAIGCSLTGTFDIVLHRKESLGNAAFAELDYPLIETADEWVLHGFSHPNYLSEFGEKARSEIYSRSSVDLAMRDAFRKARRFLMSSKGLTEDEAVSLISVAVDFGITQVANGNWGVHAIIRKRLFADAS